MLIATTFMACSDDEGEEWVSNGVKVVESQTSIATLGGSGMVKVDKTVASAYANESWLSVTSEGNTVNFTASANDDRESRNAKLVIKASANDSVIVAVSQYGAIYNVNGAKNIAVGPTGRVLTFPITYNVDTKVTSCPSWAKAVLADGVLTVTIADNTATEPREGAIELGTSKYSNTIAVKQAANADGCTDISAPAVGGSAKVCVVKGTVVKEAPEWVEASVVNDSLFITITENTATDVRQGVVKYGNDSYTNSIAVEQKGVDLEWKALGAAKYTDDMIAPIYENTQCLTYDVQIEENAKTPGLYRLVNPYGAAFPYNEDGDWDASQDYYMYINCVDPEACYVETFDTGCDWGYGNFLMASYAYLLLEAGKTMEEVKASGMCGTLVDGVITFPVKSFYVAMANYNDGAWTFYGNKNGLFKVELPQQTSQVAKKVAAKPARINKTAINNAALMK